MVLVSQRSIALVVRGICPISFKAAKVVCEAIVDKRRDSELIIHHPASLHFKGGRFPVHPFFA
jgi:hypothetical protein